MSNSDVDETTPTDAEESLLGESLREAREAKGISIEDAAAQLNLRAATLECLEAEQYEPLPGVTFIRGYIRAYANLLELDGDALSKQYVGAERSEAGVKPLQNIENERKSRARFFLVSLLLLLLVIAGLGVYWWLEQENSEQGQTNNSLIEQVEVEGVDGTLHIQSLDQLSAQTATMSVEEIYVAEPKPESELSELGREQAPVDTEQGNEVETSAAASAEPLEQEEQKDVLELSFIQDSWIRITNAQGNEVASGLKRAGEVVKLTDEAPFEIHLGFAQGVLITLNGQQINFDSKIRGNVARLKLG